MVTHTTSLPPPYISFSHLSHKETLGCRHPGALSHPSSSSRPVFLYSVGVEGGGEDDVPADGQGGSLHLAPQDGVSHDASGLSHLLQHLVQALDAAHHRALLDVGEQGDLCEGLVTGVRYDTVYDDQKQEEGREGQNSTSLVVYVMHLYMFQHRPQTSFLTLQGLTEHIGHFLNHVLDQLED